MHTVAFSPRAARVFRKLQKPVQARLQRAIDGLAETPRPPGCKKLSGADEIYRIHVGDYRLLYQVRDDELLVLIVDLGNRREIYGNTP